MESPRFFRKFWNCWFWFYAAILVVLLFQLGFHFRHHTFSTESESSEIVTLERTTSRVKKNLLNLTKYTQKSLKIVKIQKAVASERESEGGRPLVNSNKYIVFQQNKKIKRPKKSSQETKIAKQKEPNRKMDSKPGPDKIPTNPREEKIFADRVLQKVEFLEDFLQPEFTQIRDTDELNYGDFHCGSSVVPKCCAHFVKDIEEAKTICRSYSDYCKGFVLSTTVGSLEKTFKHLMYVKKDVSGMSTNYLTDFFVKTKFMKEVSWNTRQIKKQL